MPVGGLHLLDYPWHKRVAMRWTIVPGFSLATIQCVALISAIQAAQLHKNNMEGSKTVQTDTDTMSYRVGSTGGDWKGKGEL